WRIMAASDTAGLGCQHLSNAIPPFAAASVASASRRAEISMDRSRLQPGTQRASWALRLNHLFVVAGQSRRPDGYRPGQSVWQPQVQLRVWLLRLGSDRR